MDISELPFYVGILLILAAFIAVSVIAKRLSRTWLRWPVRGGAGAGAGAALTVLVLALSLLGDYSCTSRAPLAFSPDGKHVAVLTGNKVEPGSEVEVRHRFSPFAKEVYSGPEFADGGAVQMRWIDNKHLVIGYRDWPGYYDRFCAPHALGVEVACEQLPIFEPADVFRMEGPTAVCNAVADKLGEVPPRAPHTVHQVLFVLTVSPSGGVESFETAFPKGLELERVKEAADAVKKIRIQPATKDGRPVQVTKWVVFDCP
jgi:hypothetical protein